MASVIVAKARPKQELIYSVPKNKPSANAVTQFGDVDNSLRWYQATGLQRPRFPMTLFLSSAGREAEGSFLTRDRFAGGQST